MLLAFWARSARAETSGVVKDIPKPDQVAVGFQSHDVRPGAFVVFRSPGKDKSPTGYGIVIATSRGAGGRVRAIVELRLHPRNSIVRVGDFAVLVNASTGDPNWPGRVDLQTRNPHVSARYRRFVYPGIVFGRGHTQPAGEFVVEPLGAVRYGVTPWLTLETTPVLYAAQVFALATYVRVLDTEDIWATAFVQGALHTQGKNLFVLQTGAILSFPTNTKFMSHLQAVVGVQLVDARLKVGDLVGTEGAVTTEIRSRTEYVFDNWDRLLFGPLYNFDVGAVGGFLGYTMVFDHVHVGLAFQTVDFTNLKLDVFDGYTPWFTLFWRV